MRPRGRWPYARGVEKRPTDVTLRGLTRADIPAWDALLAAIGRSERSGEHYDEADLAEEMDNPDITLGIYRRAGFEVETRWSDYALVEG